MIYLMARLARIVVPDLPHHSTQLRGERSPNKKL